MVRGADKRLRRLEARCPPDPEETARGRRCRLRFKVDMAELIRVSAATAGIDPATISALRVGKEAAAELKALGETPQLARADAEARRWQCEREREAAALSGKPDLREELIAKLDRAGERYADGSNPGPDGTFMQWLAWLSVAPPIEVNAKTGRYRVPPIRSTRWAIDQRCTSEGPS